jgi:2-hydroxychromene-2-carboxylate isomerase
MKTIHFYLDFISPYAWLAFHAMPQTLQGISHRVVHKPVLFGAMLKHHGQLGPAEIASKREWTYRQVLWLAHQQGVALKLPATHPFNPLGLLRLAVACDADGEPNRYVCEQVFRHVWCSGHDAADADRLAVLTAQLNPARDPASPEVKQALQAHTEQALALGLFGVPSFVVDDKVFWGQDALPMLRAYLLGDAWFDGPEWNAVQATVVGVRRQLS